MLVNRSRDHLLAGTAFAENQHSAFRRCHPRHGFVDFQHGGSFADDLAGLLMRRLVDFFGTLIGSPLQGSLRQRLSTVFFSSARFIGLEIKSKAPSWIASTAVSMEPKAVMTMTGRTGYLACTMRVTSKP